MTGPVETALAETLEALELTPRDRAAAELARALAAEIDDAERAERYAERALERIDADAEPEMAELIRALRTKAGHRDAIVRCGQRLEAILVQLQATPASRGRSAPVLPTGGPLALLRGGAAG
jgi:tetratricopeptide (TPR) repeat protein